MTEKALKLRGAQILIVDDMPENLRILRQLLGEEGYRISISPSGEVALKVAAEVPPDIILLDVMMPGIDGFETCRRLKAMDTLHEVPVVFLTARGDVDDLVKGFEVGGADYITKPFKHEEVLARIQTHLQNSLLRRQLRAQERELSLILENATSCIWFLDHEGRVIRGNEAARALTGHASKSETIGRTLAELLPGEAGEQMHEQSMEVIRSGKPLLGISGSRIGSGDEARWFNIDRVPHLDDRNEVAGVIVFANDITAQKRAAEDRLQLERQLQRTQKLESLGVLAGGVAHDFNNLLVGVVGHADLALLKLNPLSPARANIQGIMTAARLAGELAGQMLDYSGKGAFMVEPLDLSALVRDMSHLLDASVSKKVVFHYELADDLPAVDGDATQLRQVVMNLITNASEAIGDSTGVISVTTSVLECDRSFLQSTYVDDNLEPGSYVCLEVTDTGCGMDEETLARIFEPFYSTKFTGRGLGLAALLGIVRGHRGAIKVTSSPDTGSMVMVVLPRSERTATKAEEVVAAEDWSGSGTVLLADDEVVVRTVAGEMVEMLGFTLLVAADGIEAVEVFRQHAAEIKAVILDMKMPRMNGDEAFDEIIRIDPGAKVILSSGFTESEATEHFAGKGLAGFIHKPYRLSLLRQKLIEVLGG